MNRYNLECKLKDYIQPFERLLAFKELEALSGQSIDEIDKNNGKIKFDINSIIPASELANRLTYWESILDVTDASNEKSMTRQVKLEATTNLVRNGISSESLKKILPFKGKVPSENRRNLRYGPHGIHEYRGKFFPQLVRSLLNIANLSKESIVLDPMCGSGTAPVESILLGCNAYGIDLNPLSVLISKTKCDILSVNPELLASEYNSLKKDLLNQTSKQKKELTWFKSLDDKTQAYLKRWFAPDVLEQLDPIIMRVNSVSELTCQNLFKVSLSNILRKVSWQKNDDLRVRREIRTDVDIDVLAEYLTELNRSVKTILAILFENQNNKTGEATILEGNTQDIDSLLPNLFGKVDAIVTSPPYATALPYLDTDRLSLYYLGLLSRTKHRNLDYNMIGNREVTKSLRRKYWDEYNKNQNLLTDDIISVIDKVYTLNKNLDVGFRRKNLPSLLSRYFLDMRQVFEIFKKLLRTGSPVYLIVGNNHTIAGGKRIDIRTDKLLAQLGVSVGLQLEYEIPMEMLISRDIFKKNAGNAETILFFRKV